MEGSCSTGQSPQWAVVPVEEEESNIKFHENLPSVSRIVPRGRMDIQKHCLDEANSRFSQICEDD
jgi:hypothetical protein